MPIEPVLGEPLYVKGGIHKVGMQWPPPEPEKTDGEDPHRRITTRLEHEHSWIQQVPTEAPVGTKNIRPKGLARLWPPPQQEVETGPAWQRGGLPVKWPPEDPEHEVQKTWETQSNIQIGLVKGQQWPPPQMYEEQQLDFGPPDAHKMASQWNPAEGGPTMNGLHPQDHFQGHGQTIQQQQQHFGRTGPSPQNYQENQFQQQQIQQVPQGRPGPAAPQKHQPRYDRVSRSKTCLI